MGCGNIFVRHNHYHVYTDEDECVDLLFSNEKMKELVKKYSNEQNGKIYAKYERICRAKS